MRTRSNYWSCSTFADWVRGTKKPYVGTEDEWHTWKQQAKLLPVRYWLAEHGLGKLQDLINWPRDRLYAVSCYLNNRFKTKTHALTSSSLAVGKWHEFDERILHCLFDELVDFIEDELAWSHYNWNIRGTEEDTVQLPSRILQFFGQRRRFPEAGLKYLEWASTLTDIDFRSDDDKCNAQLTHQALAAREMKVLYDWWKQRPNRVDPMEASGWYDICEEKRLFRSSTSTNNDDYRERRAASLEDLKQLEKQYEQEDEDMLYRLIKIRKSLWT